MPVEACDHCRKLWEPEHLEVVIQDVGKANPLLLRLCPPCADPSVKLDMELFGDL